METSIHVRRDFPVWRITVGRTPTKASQSMCSRRMNIYCVIYIYSLFEATFRKKASANASVEDIS